MRRLRTLPALVILLAVGSGCAFIERVDVETPAAFPLGQLGDEAAISNDGRFVAFSMLQNLTPASRRVFLRDLETGTTEAVSISPYGSAAFDARRPAVSGNGRWVAYAANRHDTPARVDIFLFDRVTDTTTRLTDQPNSGTDSSTLPVVSVDGEKVAFLSAASNLVAGDTNNQVDAFVWTRLTDTIARVNIDEVGAVTDSPVVSMHMNDSGRYVVWADQAGDVFFRDTLLSTSDHINPEFGPGGPEFSARPSVSENGRYVGFEGEIPVPGDTHVRVFRFDRTTDVLVTASLTGAGTPAPYAWIGQISGDGTMIAFVADTPLLAEDTNDGSDVYVRDLAAGRTKRLTSGLLFSEWSGEAQHPGIPATRLALSRDGNYAAFRADGTGLVDGETSGIYVRATRHTTVTSAIPSSLPDGTTTVIELVGTGFRPDTQVSLSGDARERWNVTLVHYLDENTMHVTVQIVAGAAPGPVNIVVINPGSAWGPYKGAANWCLGCLTIT